MFISKRVTIRIKQTLSNDWRYSSSSTPAKIIAVKVTRIYKQNIFIFSTEDRSVASSETSRFDENK
jgi:ribosomal protein S1